MNKEFETYKKPLVIIFSLFFGLFVYTKIAGPIPFYINNVNTSKADLFSVSETGTATAVPDTSVVNVGITQTASSVSEAQGKTNQIAGKLVDDLKKLGIAEKDIKTTNYSVYPNYGQAVPQVQNMMYPLPVRGNSAIISYTATQNLEIDVKQTEKANKVVDSATADGANLVGQVSFGFSSDTKTKLENQARAAAIKQAKEKAQNLANLSGIRLGRLVNVTESNQIRPWPVPMMEGAKSTADSSSPTNLTPGQNTVSITVTLSYETY